MAGGTFFIGERKIRPGVYHRFANVNPGAKNMDSSHSSVSISSMSWKRLSAYRWNELPAYTWKQLSGIETGEG